MLKKAACECDVVADVEGDGMDIGRVRPAVGNEGRGGGVGSVDE